MSRPSGLRRLRRPAPNRLPLRPLAAPRRRAPSLVKPRRQYRLGKQRRELALAEKVDLEPALWTRKIADGETAIAAAVGGFVGVLEVGTDGVDAQAEEATRSHARLSGTNMVVTGRAIAVLKDLDANYEPVCRSLRQRAQIAVDQAFAPVGRLLGEQAEGRRRDVEADEVESAGDERQLVAAVAAADVDTRLADQIVFARRGEDVGHKRERRLVAVAAGGVLGVPGFRGRVALIPSHRHKFIFVADADGSGGRWR